MSEVVILLVVGCLKQPWLDGDLELNCGGPITRSFPFGLDKEDDFDESIDEVREGLRDKWDASLRGMLCPAVATVMESFVGVHIWV